MFSVIKKMFGKSSVVELWEADHGVPVIIKTIGGNVEYRENLIINLMHEHQFLLEYFTILYKAIENKNKEQLKTIQLMQDEMKTVIKYIKRLKENYHDGGLVEKDLPKLKKELEKIEKLLASRIQQEEKMLYPLYSNPSKYIKKWD